MNEPAILLFCICIILLLLFLIFFMRHAFHKGTEAQLREISAKLSAILEHDSGEQIMVFTDNKALMELCGQINLLLSDRKKTKRDFKRQEISSKKMLSNISHDIKTPLTVILGYLEMMRLTDGENESLQKVEAKAQQVMELINQFFTLAKLEAGDTDITLGKTDLSELCRESILCFYDILQQKDFTVDIDIPEQTIFVSGNPDAIRRVLSNLISNAVRYGSGGSYGGHGGYRQGSASGAEDDYTRYVSAAMNYARAGRYEEALHVLSGMSQRGAEWYYAGAIANHGIGNNVTALEYARKAVELAPGHMEYELLLRQLEGGGNWYDQMSRPYGGMQMVGNDMCCKLCLMYNMCSLCCLGGRGGVICC